MSTFIQLFEVLFNQRKVENLQYDQTSLVIAVLIYTITTYWFGQIESIYGIELERIKIPIVAAAAYSIVLAIILYKLLDMSGKSERFNQFAIAFFGSSAVFGVLLIFAIQHQALILFGMAFIIWNIVVLLRIFKQTFEVSTGRAFLYFIGINLASNMVLGVMSAAFISLSTGSLDN